LPGLCHNNCPAVVSTAITARAMYGPASSTAEAD
jgi:hypothetical protein